MCPIDKDRFECVRCCFGSGLSREASQKEVCKHLKKLNLSAGLTFQSGSEKDNAEDNKRRAVVCGCAHSGARAWVNRVEARATKEGFPLPYSRRRVQSRGFFFFFLYAFTLGQQRRRAAEHRVDTRSFWSPSRLNFSQSEMTRFEG